MNIKFQLCIALIWFTIGLGYAQTKIVRMGIAGMTHDHVRGILSQPKHQGMVLVGFAEPNKELAMRYLKQYNLPDSLWFASLNDLIQNTKPDAICDFRSTYQHLETVQVCAPRGIHVMVEKPLAVNMAHAKQMEKLAQKHNIQLITNYETTWYASHHKAKQLLDDGKNWGEIRKVVIMDGHKGPKEIGCSNEFLAWLTDPVLNGGGAIMDFGCYGADIMTWLMNGQRPISVTAIAQTNKPNVYTKVDDEATIIVQYKKAQGIFQASWNWPHDRKDTEIYTEKGYIMANKNLDMDIQTGERFAKKEKLTLEPLSYPNHDAFSYFAAVINKTIPKDNALGSLNTNMVAMEILDAAIQSVKLKKTIFFK